METGCMNSFILELEGEDADSECTEVLVDSAQIVTCSDVLSKKVC